jgi:Outer membrane lipoprotein-sorting protein
VNRPMAKHGWVGIVVSALVVLGEGQATPSTEPVPQKILEGAEDARTGGFRSFVFDVKITDEGASGSRATTNYQVFIKGGERTLIKFADPTDKGKLLLTVEDNMWLYLPATSRPIRVTPLQKLFGAASNGDVGQTDFAVQYAGNVVGEETIEGKPAWVLELKAKRKGTTYSAVRYWVTKEGSIPPQAELRLTSDKPSKLTRFEEFEEVGGRRFLKRQIIVDLLRKDRKTILEFSNYEQRDLPDRFFSKNYLGEL